MNLATKFNKTKAKDRVAFKNPVHETNSIFGISRVWFLLLLRNSITAIKHSQFEDLIFFPKKEEV